jgi:hypothetical protein
MRNRLLLVLFVGFEAAALVVAWTRIPVAEPVDWAHPAGWLARGEPTAVLLAGGRLLAVGLAAWLLGSTLVATLARLALATLRLPHPLRTVADTTGRLAPGLVRHVVEGAVAVGLVTAGTGAHPASATTTAAPYAAAPTATARTLVAPLAPVRDGRRPAPLTLVPAPEAPAVPPAVPPAVASAVPPADAAPATAPVTPTPSPSPGPPALAPAERHLVVVGESLWTIAADHLRSLGLAADDRAVDRYWRALCEANRAHLASGDVNLLRPGDDLDLPPVA